MRLLSNLFRKVAPIGAVIFFGALLVRMAGNFGGFNEPIIDPFMAVFALPFIMIGLLVLFFGLIIGAAAFAAAGLWCINAYCVFVPKGWFAVLESITGNIEPELVPGGEKGRYVFTPFSLAHVIAIKQLSIGVTANFTAADGEQVALNLDVQARVKPELLTAEFSKRNLDWTSDANREFSVEAANAVRNAAGSLGREFKSSGLVGKEKEKFTSAVIDSAKKALEGSAVELCGIEVKRVAFADAVASPSEEATAA